MKGNSTQPGRQAAPEGTTQDQAAALVVICPFCDHENEVDATTCGGEEYDEIYGWIPCLWIPPPPKKTCKSPTMLDNLVMTLIQSYPGCAFFGGRAIGGTWDVDVPSLRKDYENANQFICLNYGELG